MNAHALAVNYQPIEESDTRPPAERFAGYCEIRVELIAAGTLTIAEAADELQAIARLTGLVDAIGQDEVQAIMADAFNMIDMLPEQDDGAADIIRRWELADPRDAWRHTGELPPLPLPAPPIRPAPYRTPQSTIEAFWFVVRNKDATGLADWLADHPRDETYLKNILESKCSTAAI